MKVEGYRLRFEGGGFRIKTLPVENVAGIVHCCLYLRFPSTYPWPVMGAGLGLRAGPGVRN